MRSARSSLAPVSSKGAIRCRKKFLRFFPRGFRDETYIDWERGYKWEAHERWLDSLDQRAFQSLLMAGKFEEIARIAVRIESKTNLLFSFEKMALRDAVKTAEGAQTFARGLYEYLHGRGEMRSRFEKWCEVVGGLPRRQTRVRTWPLVTVFGFIARPDEHMFLKPAVTRKAASEYGFEFDYASRPNWTTYENLLDFAKTVDRDLADLKPRDMIDIQSFLWVQGSSEYD
jgi:hypothetical protein